MEELAIKLSDIIKLIPDIGILLAAIKIFITCRHDSKMLKEIISADDAQIDALKSSISNFEKELMNQTKKLFDKYSVETNKTIEMLTKQIDKLTSELSQLQHYIHLPELPPEEVISDEANSIE